MQPGYLYILQNKAFGASVLKIGLTTREPDKRARETYSGSTGVPMPFDIAVAYSVLDCNKAEKISHKRLKTYRLNRRREFFRIPLSVADSVVQEVCFDINREAGGATPERLSFDGKSSSLTKSIHSSEDDPDEVDMHLITYVNIARLKESPIKIDALTAEQADRANILFNILSKINPVAKNKWIEGFMRDSNPESELRIWEHMAKAYLTLEHADDAPREYRDEAFELLLRRSWSSTNKVLAECKLTHFSQANAKRLLDAYELRPKPITIRR